MFATLLLLAFCIKLQWIPSWSPESPNYILPVIALSASPMAYITRLTKTSMLDALGQGLCADSEGEGRSEVEDHLQAYLAKRDDSGHHLRGTDDGLHFNRLSGCRKNFYHRRTGREVC